MLGAATMTNDQPTARASVPPMNDLLRQKRLDKFTAWLQLNGAEILAPSNEWELVRYRAHGGVHVAYRNKPRTTVTCSDNTVLEAWQAFCLHKTWRASASQKVKLTGKRWQANVNALLHRDGDECFYCGDPLSQDISIEHLVGRTHQGPNHLSNLALAHEACNQEAGSLCVVDKVKLREAKRAGRPGLSTSEAASC